MVDVVVLVEHAKSHGNRVYIGVNKHCNGFGNLTPRSETCYNHTGSFGVLIFGSWGIHQKDPSSKMGRQTWLI